MGIFKEWIEKKKLAESEFHNPITSQTLGGNPFFSGLQKLQKGLQGGQIGSGFQGHSVVANQFGLSPEETQEMLRRNIITRGQGGTDINTQRLQSFLSQIPGQSPTPRVAPLPRPQLPPPPQVPSNA